MSSCVMIISIQRALSVKNRDRGVYILASSVNEKSASVILEKAWFWGYADDLVFILSKLPLI